MDIDALTRSGSRLGETVVDPTLWPRLLQDIAESVGAFGAVLLQSGTPTVDVPWSLSLGRMREAYYGEGWNTRDLRAIRSVAAVRRGLTVLTDEDLVSRDEREGHPYYTHFLASQRSAAIAAVVFRLSASATAGLVVHRGPSQGAFGVREKQALAQLGPRLTATAELARMFAEASLGTTLAVLDRMSRPAVALGRGGAVVAVNAGAEALFDDDCRVRAGALVLRDEKAAAEVRQACEQASSPLFAAPARPRAPIVARRGSRLPLVLEVLPLDDPAGSFLSGARLLVTITDPCVTAVLPSGLLRQLFGTTGAEVRLAAHLAAGSSLQQAADVSGITIMTARSQLKSLFSKTGTRRQAELVALLGRL